MGGSDQGYDKEKNLCSEWSASRSLQKYQILGLRAQSFERNETSSTCFQTTRLFHWFQETKLRASRSILQATLNLFAEQFLKQER